MFWKVLANLSILRWRDERGGGGGEERRKRRRERRRRGNSPISI